MFDDCAIGRFYSYIDGSSKLLRVKYTIDENGVVTLGDVNEVHVVYEDVPAQASTQATLDDNGVGKNVGDPAVTNAENNEPKPATPAEPANPVQAAEQTPAPAEPAAPVVPEQAAEQTPAPAPAEPVSEPANPVQAAEQTPAPTEPTDDAAQSSNKPAVDAAQVTNAQNTNTEKVGLANEQEQEENSSSAPLTDSERAEFEALKREKKENLINSYKDNLSEEEYNGFFATIDSVSYEELETDLLKTYKRNQEEKPAKVSRAFSLASLLSRNETQESSLVAQIKANLHRD